MNKRTPVQRSVLVNKTLVTLSVCTLLWITAGSASAEAPAGGWAYELPHYLMSPFCPGRTIADCSSPQAESLRLWMIVQEAAGRTSDDVEEELLAKYGDIMRPAPRTDGFGIAAYLFPVAAFLAGGVFIAFYLRRQTRAAGSDASSNQTGPDAPPLEPELERILDEELAR